MTAVPVEEVVDLLRQLRLPHMRRSAPDLLATAKAQRWDPAEAVRALLSEELTGRQASSVGAHGGLQGSQPGRPSTVGTRPSARSPHRPSGRCGPSSGSTTTRTSSCAAHRGPARATSSKQLAHAAIDQGAHVTWFSLEALGALVRRHRADDTTGRAIKRIMRADVIVIDDIGLLPVATETAEALYRVVDAAYDKRSIALSSNLHPAGFDELMPKTIANATVDRLLHHAHVVLTAGDSIRLTQATTGKGVTPLAN